MKISIIASTFNKSITENLVKGAKDALKDKDVFVYWVPGAFELPLACKWLAESNDALVAVGTIIRGETPHFEYVSSAASQGIARISENSAVPIGFGVITADTVDQAVARSLDDENNFGYKAALAAIEMLKLRQQIANNK